MASDELNELRARVERLEREVERLRGTQGSHATPGVEAGPPPIIIRRLQERAQHAWTPEPPRRQVTPEPTRLEQPKPEKEAAPPREKVDTEFKFGSQVLPRVGITLILLGILYLVAYAIQSGWITLQMQFIGELTLCAGLIGLGLWKLNEKEDFGQVLIGGGSCGMYLSFAGGHVFKSLYGGDVLVVLFLALSLANLAFSWWRSSKSFWAIGFVGGLVAAGLPLDKHDTASTLVLAATIVVAATLLAAARRWLRAIESLWLVACLFVLVVLVDAVQRSAVREVAAIWILYGFSLVPIFAHAVRFEPTEFDPSDWFDATAGAFTALATLIFATAIHPVPHSVSVIGLALLLGIVAWAVRKGTNAKAISITALASATVIAPMGFPAFQACLIYASLGIVASLFTYVRVKGFGAPAAVFCATHVALSIIAYAIAMGGSVPARSELVLLGAIALGIGNLASIAGKLGSKMEDAVTTASILLYFVLIRASFLSLSGLGLYSILFSTAAYAIVLSIISLRTKWQGPGLVGLFLIGLTTVLYWSNGSDGAMGASAGRQIAALALSTVALVLSTLAIGRSQVGTRTISIVNSVIGCFIVVPLFWQTLQVFGLIDEAAVVLALCLYAIVLAAVSGFSQWKGHAIVGMTVASAAVIGYISYAYNSPDFTSNTLQMPLVVMTGLSLAATAYFSGQDERERRAPWLIAAVIGWYIASRLFFLVLTLPQIGIGTDAAWQTSWALYAIALCFVSLRTKWQALGLVAAAPALAAALGYWFNVLNETPVTREHQIIVTFVASVATVLTSLAIGKDAAERKSYSVLGAIVGWTVAARLFGLLFLAAGMQVAASVSFSWALYAGILLTIGFVYDVKPLRITSLTLFGLTICKVILVDLSELEAYIRVFLLIILGALLVLGGYIYLRRREGAKAA